MKMKTIFLILLSFLFGIATFYIFSYVQSVREENERINALTFLNTYTWDPYFLETAQNASVTERYEFPSPPKNSSRVTKNDLAVLHEYQNSRTDENIKEIEQEIYLDNAFFGEYTFAELTDKVQRPKTHALMQIVAASEVSVIMQEKLIHNRVRPSHLDPLLVPIIEVPHHPSYPSGHGTQAHLRALILSALHPSNHKNYTLAAERITRNREIAGVHYPSDSQAGKKLANILFTNLLQQNGFSKLLEEAKAEW